MNPFLKWPGGKRWFISKYQNYIPEKFNNYIEPFLGGGSVFFYLQPEASILSDINTDLINVFLAMRDNHEQLRDILCAHQKLHNIEYYYHIREYIPEDPIAQAARFLYLNRTCFNGMYRVNRQGKFNVPIGTKSNCTYDIDKFPLYARSLKKAEISVSDFGPTIRRARYGDFLFVDPPYTIAHNQNSFIKYNENLFSWNDQIRLLKDLSQANASGALIISTNANYYLIKEMYQDCGFYTKSIQRYCSISGSAKGRSTQEELLISSLPFLEE